MREDAASTLVDQARAAFAAGLAAVDAEASVSRALFLDGEEVHTASGVVPVPRGGRVLVLGGGKAAEGMVRGVLGVLGDRVQGGLVVTRRSEAGGSASRRVGPVHVVSAAHPVPDVAGVRATRRILDLADGLGHTDLALVVLSGGGSSLLCAPRAEVGLAGMASVTRRLLLAGATIDELNAVRRALSTIKGGGLLRHIRPAACLTLAISDVAGDDPATLASGPTVFTPPSAERARQVLERYAIAVPPAWLSAATPAELPAPPSAFAVVARLADALDGAEAHARSLGWDVWRQPYEIVGEARVAGRLLAERLLSLRGRCLVAGGEPVVVVRGGGRGGRAQELALAASEVLRGHDDVALLAAGTDGSDGPTDAAGAIVDGGTWSRLRTAGFAPRQALDDNDSYRALDAVGALLRTGPTGTNVRDVVIGMHRPAVRGSGSG